MLNHHIIRGKENVTMIEYAVWRQQTFTRIAGVVASTAPWTIISAFSKDRTHKRDG